jgi:hypothetical protein
MATAESSDEYSSTERARDELQEAVPDAAKKLRDLLDADDERIQIRAAEAILDRAGITKAKANSVRTAQREVGGGDTKDEDDLLSDMSF